MNFEEYNALGSIVEDMYGSAVSDSNGSFKIVSKITSENRMRITCMVVVNLLTRQHMHQEANKSYEQCAKAVNEHLKLVKKQFKKKCGRALKTKELGKDNSVELINMSGYSDKGTALCRCVYDFEIK